ncbi:conserved hypothetical protein [Coccidioides posadasii str. Silveira]|uniref:Uncharacterized protein n=1 Tax=Coccidioides posadasii (strain RMSCC 757 / Silveira) TaxID=443226 RepID=E9D212_COCPS|nr:conserved hypothetical protein [Coccidioides posadasii str. Silveira]
MRNATEPVQAQKSFIIPNGVREAWYELHVREERGEESHGTQGLSFVLRTEKLLKYPRIREVVRTTPQPHMCGKERGKCQTQLPAAIIPRVKRGDDVSRSVGTGHGVWDMAFARAAIAGKTLWVSLLAGRDLKRSMSPHSWRHGTWLFLDEQRSGDVVLDELGETTLSDRLHEVKGEVEEQGWRERERERRRARETSSATPPSPNFSL